MNLECFVEDLFLGGQWSIILGYRRLSVKSLLVHYFYNSLSWFLNFNILWYPLLNLIIIPQLMMSALEVMCCLLQLIICGIMNQFFGFLDRTHLFENQEISSYEGFNVMPRRIPDFPDSFHSWNFLSSIGSGITFLSFAMFCYLFCSSPIISFIFWNSFAILWFIIWNLLCFVLYSLFSSETCLLASGSCIRFILSSY